MTHHCRVRRAAGFTLLEVLVAIGLFAIAVSIVYSLYATMVAVVERVEERTALNDRVRTALERINQDLAGLYRGRQGYLVGRRVDYRNDEPFLEFLSSAHLVFAPQRPPVPLTRIRLYLQEVEVGTYSLLRSDTPVLPGEEAGSAGEGRRLVLCQGLAGLELTFFRGLEERDQWDSRNDSDQGARDDLRFPIGVRLALVFADEEADPAERHATTAYLRPALLTFEEN